LRHLGLAEKEKEIISLRIGTMSLMSND
jgi:hypothetical protein